jgi:hypothetical protein
LIWFAIWNDVNQEIYMNGNYDLRWMAIGKKYADQLRVRAWTNLWKIVRLLSSTG